VKDLEVGKWYLVSSPHEGDIFYPVHILDSDHFIMDGSTFRIEDNCSLIFEKAVLPSHTGDK